MTFNEKYVKEMDAISLSEDFESRTAELMKQRVTGKEEKNLMKRKPVKVLAAAFAVIALLSVTAFALSYLLSAKEVAEKIGGKELAGLFESGTAEHQLVSDGTYDVIFLGKATGETLNKTEGFAAEEENSYAVFAVRRTDGTPLSLSDGMPFQLAPVIEDCMPYITWGVLEGATGCESEGVLYYLFKYENLEVFADRTVSIAIIGADMFPTAEILTLDENGKIIYGESYKGIKGIFELPMDKTKADPEAAEELLGNY